MKGLLALVEKAVQLGLRTVGAEKRAALRARNAAPSLGILFKRVAEAAGGLRGQKDIQNANYNAPHILIGTARLRVKDGTLDNVDENSVGRVFRSIKGVLSAHVRALENDYKQAKQRTEEADDAHYTVCALIALLDVEGVPAHRKEEIVRRAFEKSAFRDAMDAVEDTGDKDAIGKFVRGQAGVESAPPEDDAPAEDTTPARSAQIKGLDKMLNKINIQAALRRGEDII